MAVASVRGDISTESLCDAVDDVAQACLAGLVREPGESIRDTYLFALDKDPRLVAQALRAENTSS